MLRTIRLCARIVEFLVAAPVRAVRFVFSTFVFNPRLGRLRILTGLAAGYVIFGLILVYPFAFFWGLAGQAWFGKVLIYANERSLGTAIYDDHSRFVGILDPILDSEEDFNYTGRPIRLPGYIAYPDHKSLHVSVIPEHYWRCLAYHEDRHLGGLSNPFGIDLIGYLKIPLSTIAGSLQTMSIRLGAGGSTIPMQLARIFFKTPPSADEGAFGKIGRKIKEWWLAPVIYRELTRGDDKDGLKRWAANHFPLAQRTGGQALYGVEQTSLIVFGKPASELGIAEQYVLAAAVNQPIVLLTGSEKLNRYRLESWRRVTGKRARVCADRLIADAESRREVVSALTALTQTPPDPKTPPEMARALEELAPEMARPAGANPIRRSNTLIPAAKYGVRDEMKNRFGFGWRSHVSGVRLTLDVTQNLAFRERVLNELAKLQSSFAAGINPAYSLDVRAMRSQGDTAERQVPDVVIAAADRDGAIVRYFESNFTAAYFGSAQARDPKTGKYDVRREGRFIASVAKMAAAVAIANEDTDAVDTGYLDIAAPTTGLEACRKGEERRLRRADVAFACSLNVPIEWRIRQIGTDKLKRIASTFSLALPQDSAPLAKSLAVGQIGASPRTVHQMAAAILSALTKDDAAGKPMVEPTLVRGFDRQDPTGRRLDGERPPAPEESLAVDSAAPRNPIRPAGRQLLGELLSAPLCYRHGTLRRLSDWCAERRSGVRLHFAKTGTRGTGALEAAADDTVDLWVAGGIQFDTGPAYSYVVLIGSGNPNKPWARDLYAGAVAEPLVRALLQDLSALAARESKTVAAKPPPATDAKPLTR